MNIEESIKEIEKIKEIFIHLKNYGWINDIKKDINTDNAIQAIGTLLTAYEKEKEKNKELTERVLKLESDKFWDNVVSKSKIKAKVIEIKDRPVKDEFITATQGKLNTIIDIESLLDEEE